LLTPFLFIKELKRMTNEILIADEAAQLLRVSKQRIYELARTNKIPTIRVGERQFRFSKQAIEKWLENGGNTENKRHD
jgi:excisionase family DNA binding protein